MPTKSPARPSPRAKPSRNRRPRATQTSPTSFARAALCVPRGRRGGGPFGRGQVSSKPGAPVGRLREAAAALDAVVLLGLAPAARAAGGGVAGALPCHAHRLAARGHAAAAVTGAAGPGGAPFSVRARSRVTSACAATARGRAEEGGGFTVDVRLRRRSAPADQNLPTSCRGRTVHGRSWATGPWKLDGDWVRCDVVPRRRRAPGTSPSGDGRGFPSDADAEAPPTREAPAVSPPAARERRGSRTHHGPAQGRDAPRSFMASACLPRGFVRPTAKLTEHYVERAAGADVEE